MSQTVIKVLIAEDIDPIRKRYVHILSQAELIEVVADVGSGAEAVKEAHRHHPDVILMDIEMETRDAGLQAAREIFLEFPEIKIVILTVYEEDALVFSAFQLGVCDYMLKNSTPDEIVSSVRDAYYGNSPIRPQIATKIRTEFRRVKQYESSFLYTLNIMTNLTQSEVAILYLLSQNMTRKQICKERHVEMSTVKSQIHTILQKFDKKSIREIIDIVESLNLFEIVMKNSERKLGDER